MIQAGKTLSARKWHAAFSPEGYLDIGKTLSRIHRGVIQIFFLSHFLLLCLGFNDLKSLSYFSF